MNRLTRTWRRWKYTITCSIVLAVLIPAALWWNYMLIKAVLFDG